MECCTCLQQARQLCAAPQECSVLLRYLRSQYVALDAQPWFPAMLCQNGSQTRPHSSACRIFAFGETLRPTPLLRFFVPKDPRWSRLPKRAGAQVSNHGALNIVAISGGADNGAFGAGLLVGWSDAGTRPDFDVVTGVSAGALTAPFVYLGRSRDAELKDVFTKYTRSDIYDPGIMPLLIGSGLVDSFSARKSDCNLC